MSLTKVGDKAMFNPLMAAMAQYHDGKGLVVLGKSGKPIVYVAEEDSVKGLEMMKSVCADIRKSALKHPVIELNEHAVISTDYIGAISVAPEKAVVINNAEGEVIYWLEETNTDKAELICSELLKAYDTANGKKAHVIDWPTLMAD